MPTCSLCKTSFPNRAKIDGKVKKLHNRKYCLKCSPYGLHNTRKLNETGGVKGHICGCGETDPDKFYGGRKTGCKECHKKTTKARGKKQKERIIEHLGGGCCECGYNRYSGALDVHHLDPTKKDKNFIRVKGWGWKRILKEIKDCVLLCRVCHAEVHAGLRKI